MEEVDRILIRSLRDIGCQVDDSLQNVSTFDVNTLFGCVSQCLQLITANKDLPTRLPPNISTRFKVCGELAQLCQSNGYKGDIGYQTFLSINENETRKLLNFLIEKVPREATVTIASSTLDPWDALDRILSNKITTQLAESTWISHDLVIDLCHIPVHHPAASFAHKSGFTPTKHTQVSCLHVPPVKGKNKLSADSSSYVFAQVDFQNLADSLMYENQVSCWIEKQRESSFLIPGQLTTHKFSKEICRQIHDGDTIGAKYEYINRTDMKKKLDDSLLTRSRFMHTNVNEQQSNGFDENPKRTIDHTEELERLKASIAENEELIRQLELQLQKLEESIKKYEQFSDEKKTEIDNINKDMTVKKQAAAYLLSVDPETERLQNAIDKLKKKITTLETQWVDVRSNLIEQRDSLLQALNDRLAKFNDKLSEINDMKAKGRLLLSDIKEKDEQLIRLQHDYETHKSSISKNDHSRSFFTKQILEIVANTNKQKEEINKTIIETRVLQKDLNRLTEKLERTFQVTDSQLFKDAKTDECARRSYKMLVAFHSDCDTIYKIVEDIGVIIREIRELEDQIEVESQKNMTTNLETLIGEYKKVRDENTALKGEKK
ncbi:unnamed protein product [Rotaria socialis]|uniref:Coiled-coil domain-containing protein 22 homolog n=1 Tax=Rotaria socialis TaxID=392032 RepID=A0A818HCD4_9BILA|nr:unnamed protein product [Rotaria socialis]CAF3478807.1 unnamed protein product [Rotaria socialis]CAF3502202.1 unnamed protein product [Rotaria socialis]CAF3529247.1 unnamed protein product [Rotaria socialis]CAF3587835.1 unnamed protein product [Rotaria socialis]